MSDHGLSEGEYQELFGDDSPRSDVWITRNGRAIPVADMEDSHLLNTIKFLRRNVMHYQMDELSKMGRYIAQAPDGAADACSSEADYIMSLSDDDYLKHRFPVFQIMLAVAAARNLI